MLIMIDLRVQLSTTLLELELPCFGRDWVPGRAKHSLIFRAFVMSVLFFYSGKTPQIIISRNQEQANMILLYIHDLFEAPLLPKQIRCYSHLIPTN